MHGCAASALLCIVAFILSIQLVRTADVLAFGAEAGTTSGAVQNNNILMDLARFSIQGIELHDHYRSDPVQVQSMNRLVPEY